MAAFLTGLIAVPTARADDPNAATLPTLEELQGWRPAIKGGVKEQEPSLRERALRETAWQVGSQAALAQRTREQNVEVETYAPWLTEIYRFDQLLSERGLVLPPVVIEARRHAEVSGLQLTKIEQSYKMIENAKVVSAPPTWREYLIASSYPPPVRPEGALLPQTPAEERLWTEAGSTPRWPRRSTATRRRWSCSRGSCAFSLRDSSTAMRAV